MIRKPGIKNVKIKPKIKSSKLTPISPNSIKKLTILIVKYFFQDKALVASLLLGLALRLCLSMLPGFQIDVNDWFAWAIRLSHFNFVTFYSKDFFTDYTPGYLYILSVLGFLKNFLQMPDRNFYLLLKIPAIISDLVIALLAFYQIKKVVPEKLAFLAFLFILFNPAIIFNSAVWGQVDSILTLFLLITVISLKKNNLIFGSIFYGLSLLIKPQALALIPVLAIFLINQFKLLNLFKLLVPGLLIIFILALPFFPNQTLVNLAHHITNTAGEYPYTSLFAYNLWGAVGFWLPDNKLWQGISYQNLGYILFLSYWVTIVYFYFRNKLSIYTLGALAAMGFFFLPTRAHERYLYPALIFLILSTVTFRSRLLLTLTGALSLLHFLDLYYVYVYYNEIFLKLPKVLYNPFLYSFLDTNGKNLSLISTAIFILISVILIKYDIALKKA